MFRSIDEFVATWKMHADGTKKLMAELTDQSLSQRVTDKDRTLGRMAWHIATAIPEMSGHTGLKLAGPNPEAPVPKTAREIKEAYTAAADSLPEQIKKNWTDKDLLIEDDMYGMMWKRGLTLRILIDHEVHHRGQMTVLMRQAGLKVPGVYGPSRDEWAAYGGKEPEI